MSSLNHLPMTKGFGDLGFHDNATYQIRDRSMHLLNEECPIYQIFMSRPVALRPAPAWWQADYSLRTGVPETPTMGGAMMATSEITIAWTIEVRKLYYRNFLGKWQSKWDNYPCVQADQGFDEIVNSTSSRRNGTSRRFYDFPSKEIGAILIRLLWHNNEQQKYSGYCSDNLCNEAIQIHREKIRTSPFHLFIV